MKNLIIGNTSQISSFFPLTYERISSRNIDFHKFVNERYDRVYITFAEQRTFDKNLSENDFLSINVDLTSKVIDFFSKISNKVIVYGTAELWNNHNGSININTTINYKYSPYVKSKEVLYELILNKKSIGNWNNVVILHSFNFNSLQRKSGFLFYKIFNSLINNEIANVGDLNINRDIIHPKYLVSKSLLVNEDCIIGSGKLTNVDSFISDLFQYYMKDYKEFIISDKSLSSNHVGNQFWLETNDIYDNLLNDTVEEINNSYRIKA